MAYGIFIFIVLTIVVNYYAIKRVNGYKRMTPELHRFNMYMLWIIPMIWGIGSIILLKIERPVVMTKDKRKPVELAHPDNHDQHVHTAP